MANVQLAVHLFQINFNLSFSKFSIYLDIFKYVYPFTNNFFYLLSTLFPSLFSIKNSNFFHYSFFSTFRPGFIFIQIKTWINSFYLFSFCYYLFLIFNQISTYIFGLSMCLFILEMSIAVQSLNSLHKYSQNIPLPPSFHSFMFIKK